MTLHVISEREISMEAAQVLISHMSPSKAARFLASWQIGTGDYLVLREQLFQQETVASFFTQIKQFEDDNEKQQ